MKEKKTPPHFVVLKRTWLSDEWPVENKHTHIKSVSASKQINDNDMYDSSGSNWIHNENYYSSHGDYDKAVDVGGGYGN